MFNMGSAHDRSVEPEKGSFKESHGLLTVGGPNDHINIRILP